MIHGAKKLLNAIEQQNVSEISQILKETKNPKITHEMAIAALGIETGEILEMFAPYVSDAFWINETFWQHLLNSELVEVVELVFNLSKGKTPEMICNTLFDEYLDVMDISSEIKKVFE